MAQTDSKDSLNIEVVYALPHKADLIRLKLPHGCSLQQALEVSGLMQKYPEIDSKNGRFGIYGKLCNPATLLRDQDRVEIYRPLQADPKEVRRRRAEEGKATKKGGGAAGEV
ncbi:MAG: RnfH family protein [Betaproteobacteria bacterium]|nr:RnfH family protein [Betaproteobacteria bacterium]